MASPPTREHNEDLRSLYMYSGHARARHYGGGNGGKRARGARAAGKSNEGEVRVKKGLEQPKGVGGE